MRRERLAPGLVRLPEDVSRKEPVDPAFYERKTQIGSGSYGTVFKAQRDGKMFAIKTHKNMNNYAGDQIRYRLMNEIIMLASGVILGKSECPYVIKLKDWYEKNEQFGLIMDYHRTDLHQVLSKCSFTEEETAFFLAEIVLAIEAVHSAGVIHNDIKPENILIDNAGHAILTDFGIAEIGADKKYGRYGTPVYMSPESLKICGHDRQADWWSFGVMMYEMLAGYLPFEGRSSADLIRSQRKKLHFPGHMSKDAVDLLQRILNRNPLKRLSTNVDKVKSHPFFASIDWKKLERGELESPLARMTDISNAAHAISADKRKRREDSSMFVRMKLFFKAKKRFVQSAPASPQRRKCKLRQSRFSLRSLVPRFSTGNSTNQKSGCNV